MSASEPRTILIATGNPGKFREIVSVLAADGGSPIALHLAWKSLADLDNAPPEPHEDGTTFAQNAALKARYYSRHSGLWILADDSGLEVDALGGDPGVRSARYADVPAGAGRRAADAANNRKLLAALAGMPAGKRTARFRCALALADGDRIRSEASGVIEGVILEVPRGSGGFGYDPLFFVPELGKTTAEMTLEEKNGVSHRGKALRAMRECLLSLVGVARGRGSTGLDGVLP